ncbi:carboxypeptidase-like regulatory domain-containing protein [Bryobacter aggregatus]|uniref:carboxypeptidase-like regulatory domain-containing protein n=1 Tax=Bryobacter aggregatus TaxID=360054 RepID=UPI0004E203EE|nr:carboxypeptidase-like regulatory domain-containing protein [Bryobacter aggregatus]
MKMLWVLMLIPLGLAAQDNWEVSGRVTGVEGSPKDFYVNLQGPQYVKPVQTDGDGRFSFQGTQAGVYVLHVEKKHNTSEPRSRTLRLSAGQKMSGIEIQIPEAGVISGRIRDDADQPVAGLLVLAMSRAVRDGKARFELKGSDRSNDLGEYRIGGVPRGAYMIVAMARPALPVSKVSATPTAPKPTVSNAPLVVFAPEGRAYEAASIVNVQTGEKRPGVDIRWRKEATHCVSFEATGAVRDAEAPSMLYVSLKSWSSGEVLQSIAEGMIEANEAHQICGVPSGSYKLHLSSFTKDRRRGIGYTRVSVEVGKSAVQLGVIPLHASLPVEGTIRIEGAAPEATVPSGMQFRLVRGDRGIMIGEHQQEKVDADGKFRFPAIYADGYGMVIEGMPQGHYIRKANQNGRNILVDGLRPGDGRVEVVLASNGASVQGRVLGEKDVAIPDATIFLAPRSGGEALIAQSDQHGVFSFPSGLAPGEYSAVAVADLMESERRSAHVWQRYSIQTLSLRLGEKESKQQDLKAIPAVAR